ncbi:MAG: hypothetical protein J5968_03470 [Oscillospiraceae bacterium]|nr:hypothetical protein [Oscillospiraceae bacterium]
MTGRIIRQTGGFYYVETERGVIECRARGLFRKEKITPLVGDNVEVDMTENGKGYVTAILPRKNSLSVSGATMIVRARNAPIRRTARTSSWASPCSAKIPTARTSRKGSSPSSSPPRNPSRRNPQSLQPPSLPSAPGSRL